MNSVMSEQLADRTVGRSADHARPEAGPEFSERLLLGVLNSSHDGIMAFESVRDDSGSIVDFRWTVVNPAAEALVGRRAVDILGERLLVEMPGNKESGLFDIYVDVVETGQPHVDEHHYEHEGLDNWFLTTAVRLDDGFAVTFRDITEQTRLRVVLEHQLTHDQLTGLPNRVQLEERVGRDLADLSDSSDAVTVMFLGLDRFRVVNDSLGHAAGDALLVEFARRLTGSLRPTDTVARVGGDEFVVLFDQLAPDDIDSTVERLLATCDTPFEIDGHEVFVGVTVGVARSESPDITAESLIFDADSLMCEAKVLGGNQAQFARPAAPKPSTDRVRLEADLRCAIELDQLRVVYQPVVNCRSGRISGAEALVRWQHPERGLVGPGAFLPIAEATGLIVPIGSWVLEQATRQVAAWNDEFSDRPPIAIAVNASARQLTSPGFAGVVGAALEAADLDAGRLCVEVTETALIGDPRAAERTLRGLSEMGVLIALDDFGTGYSPITYLQRFPVDIIKIDRSFISGPDASATDATLVDALIGLAGALGKTATAEGVENEAQLERVRNANHYQGYHFSKPLAPDEFEALLHDRS